MSQPRHAASQVKAIAEHVEQRFRSGRRVLSFAEFLDLFDQQPVRYSRDASRYLRDVFDHYGTTTVRYPWGEHTRFKLFDLPWEPRPPARCTGRPAARRPRRPGARAGGDLPRALQLRARGARQPPRPAARPERLGEVDHRRSA